MPQIKIDYMISEGTGATGEPVRKSSWEVMIPSVIGELQLYAQTVSFPKPSAAQIDVFHFNEVAKIAGQPRFDDVVIGVMDVVDPAIASDIHDWWKLVYDAETGIINYASDYKKAGVLYNYDTKGALVHGWSLVNLWPSQVDFGAGDYSSKDPVIIQMTLSCDRVLAI